MWEISATRIMRQVKRKQNVRDIFHVCLRGAAVCETSYVEWLVDASSRTPFLLTPLLLTPFGLKVFASVGALERDRVDPLQVFFDVSVVLA